MASDKQTRARWREASAKSYAKRREKILFNRLHNIKPPTTRPKSKTITKRKTQPKPKSQPKLVHTPSNNNHCNHNVMYGMSALTNMYPYPYSYPQHTTSYYQYGGMNFKQSVSILPTTQSSSTFNHIVGSGYEYSYDKSVITPDEHLSTLLFPELTIPIDVNEINTSFMNLSLHDEPLPKHITQVDPILSLPPINDDDIDSYVEVGLESLVIRKWAQKRPAVVKAIDDMTNDLNYHPFNSEKGHCVTVDMPYSQNAAPNIASRKVMRDYFGRVNGGYTACYGSASGQCIGISAR